ncbi:hypothetical protein ACFQS1_27555 [Paractinoplanes rhizophilus]|uniref:Leucyl aminopeptidase (Aminopeptidase T) n=1 Tax=Paractinoplanes rhizophilus TaxID=1416877 RepID=A0ABW2HY81_9ACTN
MHVGADDRVLIVHDDTAAPDTVDAFVAATGGLGAEVTVLRYAPRTFVSMREFGRFAEASVWADDRHAPETLLAALGAADVGLILNADLRLLFDPRFLATLSGTRIGWIPYLDADNIQRLLPSSADEVAELHQASTVVGEAMAATTEVTIGDANGTDLRMRIGAHRINWSTGVHMQGRGIGGVQIWPGGQISTAPDIGSVSGRLVIDRSVNAPEYKELLDPIGFTVVDGLVTDIDGGVEAERMRRYLSSLDHPGAYHLTELGIGTNARCVAAGYAGPCEDTHTWGALSMALGADVHLGGVTRAPCHVDMTARSATVAFDGKTVVDEGRLVV